MKDINDILLLGDPRLYQKCKDVQKSDTPMFSTWISDLDNVMKEVRLKYNFGRAIAAPQLGIMKRLIYMKIDKPIVFINPKITFKSNKKFELWDDCMSFPNLLVKVKRHKTIVIEYLDENWDSHQREMSDELSELLQHEYDHLDGILCTMRAIDSKSFKWRN